MKINHKISKVDDGWRFDLHSDLESVVLHVSTDPNGDTGTCLGCGCKHYEKSKFFICKTCKLSDDRLAADKSSFRKISYFLKAGVTASMKLPSVRAKVEQTNLERHGTKSPLGSSTVRRKIAETNLERYGSTSPTSSKSVKAKVKQTNLERYGVTNPGLMKDHHDRVKATSIERYGVENFSQSEEGKQRIKDVMIERYGVEYFSQSEAYKEKVWETSIERYGVEHFASSDHFKNVVRKSNMEKYGVASALSLKSVVDAQKKTRVERYGAEWPFQSDQIKEKVRATHMKNHGVAFPFQSDVIQDKVTVTLVEAFGESRVPNKIEERFGLPFEDVVARWRAIFLEDGIQAAMAQFPISASVMYEKFLLPSEKKATGSKIEDVVAATVSLQSGIEFERNVRSIVPGNNKLEIDMLSRDDEVSIEFNGFYWHQIKEDKLGADLDKAERMRGAGFTHLAIDETDMNHLDKISTLVNPNKKRFFARKLELRKIDNPASFLEENHLQGSIPSRVAFGLFDGDELIQVMTFGASRFDKLAQWEILRLATKSDSLVVGGAQKLWKAFLREKSPLNVVSYSDNKYFSGSIYPKLGMVFEGNTKPSHRWMKNGKVLSRFQTMKHLLHGLLGSGFDPMLTADQNMEKNGWVKISDLGSKKWRFESS